MNSDDILQALIAKTSDQTIWVSELPFGQGDRRCDFWTLSPHPSKGHIVNAYEIKISKADFKRDSYEKQRFARLFSDRFWYVTPSGLLKKEEVPDWAGLLEYDGADFKFVIPAPRRDKDAPTWDLVVSLLRYSGEVRRDTDQCRKELAHYKRAMDGAKEKMRKDGIEPWRYGLL